MRLCQILNIQNNLNQTNFTEFFLKIGDDKYSKISDTEDTIELPLDIVISKENLKNLIDFIYLNLIKNSANANYFVGRAILTSKNIYINKILDTIIEKFSGKVHIYPNVNLVDLTENSNANQPQIYSPNF